MASLAGSKSAGRDLEIVQPAGETAIGGPNIIPTRPQSEEG